MENVREVIIKEFAQIIVNHVPPLKVSQEVYMAVKNSRGCYEQKKFEAFIFGTDDISESDIKRIKNKIGDSAQWNKFAFRILLIVESVDTLEKATLIGKSMQLIDDDFRGVKYLRLCKMIEQCFYEDLLYLTKFESEDSTITSKNEHIPSISLESLFANGFISEVGFDGGDISGIDSGTIYALNEYGIKVRHLM